MGIILGAVRVFGLKRSLEQSTLRGFKAEGRRAKDDASPRGGFTSPHVQSSDLARELEDKPPQTNPRDATTRVVFGPGLCF